MGGGLVQFLTVSDTGQAQVSRGTFEILQGSSIALNPLYACYETLRALRLCRRPYSLTLGCIDAMDVEMYERGILTVLPKSVKSARVTPRAP